MKTHGRKGTPEYVTWIGIKKRCENQKSEDYPWYGGRGIRVSPRWQKFENFFADMGPRPSRKHSIDRINNDGNYEPGNCRWATLTEQGRNRSNNKFLEHAGRRLTLIEWSEETGINEDALRHRIRSGWSVSDALTRPMRGAALAGGETR